MAEIALDPNTMRRLQSARMEEVAQKQEAFVNHDMLLRHHTVGVAAASAILGNAEMFDADALLAAVTYLPKVVRLLDNLVLATPPAESNDAE